MSIVDSSTPSGAIVAAVRAIEGLHGRHDGEVLDFEIGLSIDLETWGREAINKAFLLLIGVAFDSISIPVDQPELRHRLVGAALTQLRKADLEEVPDACVPTIAGGLTAAALGLDVCAWRTLLGPIPDEETIAWAYALFVLVGFLDDMTGAGTFGRRVTESIGLDG